MTTKAQQRVDLAKDVLAQLKAKKIAAVCSQYCGPGRDPGFELEPIAEECAVCAVGALMVACCGPAYYVSADTVTNCLTPLFSKTQIGLIEAAFEQKAAMPLNDFKVTTATLAAAKMYSRRIKPATRMRAIMKNLIDNNGRFVVPKL